MGGTWMQAVLLVLVTRTALFWVVLVGFGGTDPFAGLSPFVAGVFVLGGVLASGVGRVVFAIGIDRIGSSLSNAFTNTRPLFAVLMAVVWLGETVTAGMAAGVLVLVFGLVTLSLSRGGDVSGWERTDLVFPLTAALVFAAANVVRRFGFTVSPVTSLQAVTVGETAALVSMAAFAAATGRLGADGAPRRAFGYFAVNGLTAAVGLFAFFAALRAGPVSIVDPVTATAPLVTTAVAYLVLRDVERVTHRLVLGVVLVVGGVAVLTATAA
jgi:drug/metabolite transporter (DMT)-like permease